MVAMYVPKIVLNKEPIHIPVAPQVIAVDPTQIMNNKLNILIDASHHFPEVPVNALMEIVVPDDLRRRAIEQLKKH